MSRHESLLAADWILPIASPPVENGGLLLCDGTVIDCGPLEEVRSRHPGVPVTPLPPGAVMPGLVNAHTHLELASLDRIPADGGFAAWASRVIAAKERLAPETVRDGVRRAAERMRACGTAHVADVSNFGVSPGVLAGLGFPATVFHEFIGTDPALFDAWEAGRPAGAAEGSAGAARILPACHTPFSAGPELIGKCARWAAKHDAPWSLHLAETADETEYLVHGRGLLADLLRERGIEGAAVTVPAMRSVPYVESLGCLDERLIAVHLVQADEEDVALLARRGVRPCLCPSSNLHLAGKLPPIAAMLTAGLRPALGTDSPVSGESFDLFREMEILLDAGVDAAILLTMATRYGAEALRLTADYGRIEKGRKPRLIHLAIDGDSRSEAGVRMIRAGARGRVRTIDDILGSGS